jgi:hypothetical protein
VCGYTGTRVELPRSTSGQDRDASVHFGVLPTFQAPRPPRPRPRGVPRIDYLNGHPLENSKGVVTRRDTHFPGMRNQVLAATPSSPSRSSRNGILANALVARAGNDMAQCERGLLRSPGRALDIDSDRIRSRLDGGFGRILSTKQRR